MKYPLLRRAFHPTTWALKAAWFRLGRELVASARHEHNVRGHTHFAAYQRRGSRRFINDFHFEECIKSRVLTSKCAVSCRSHNARPNEICFRGVNMDAVKMPNLTEHLKVAQQ